MFHFVTLVWYLTANGRAATRLAAEGLAASLNDRLATDDKTVLLAPVGHGNGPLNAALVDWTRAGDIPILGYFKSLHDEGRIKRNLVRIVLARAILFL